MTLLESKGWLGGLTHSFRRGDAWVDNGQHVFLRCCTSYLALLERLGTGHLATLQPRLDVPVRSALDPRTSRLRRGVLPAPLQLSGSLAMYRWLPPVSRARVATAALAMRRIDRDDPAVDDVSFGAWLETHGQSPRAVEAVWDLIGVATLNGRAADTSLALAATVFQLGLLESASAADVGWSTVPLRALHGDPAEVSLAAAGVDVKTGARVAEVVPSSGRWSVRHAGGELIVDDVVLAVPPPMAEELAPDATDLAPGWSARLGSSPIVNLHVHLDRTVLDEPFVAAVDSPLQWVFDRTAQSGTSTGQYLAVSLSAADDAIDERVGALRARFLPELERLLPGVARASVLDFFVTRERHATFRPSPGSRRSRPGTRTRRTGLHLAGAWTDTGWPATMEGAVRSGEAAAQAVLDRSGNHVDLQTGLVA